MLPAADQQDGQNPLEALAAAAAPELAAKDRRDRMRHGPGPEHGGHFFLPRPPQF